MWELVKYLTIVFFILTILLSNTSSYYQFAIISELVWLSIFAVSSICGTYVNDVILFSLPFVILTLTAIEAVVIWSLILFNYNLLMSK